jgi:hypothetical protein
LVRTADKRSPYFPPEEDYLPPAPGALPPDNTPERAKLSTGNIVAAKQRDTSELVRR